MSEYRRIRSLLAQATLSCLLVALHAGTSHGQWIQTSGPKGGSIRSLLAVPRTAGGIDLFAGSTWIWRTSDNGANWTRLKNGLTDPTASELLAVPNVAGGHDIYIGTSTGVFRSTDNGASWSPANSGIGNQPIHALASGTNGSGGTNLYAGAGSYAGKVFRSGDNAASWTEVSSGLPVGQANIQGLITTASGTILAGTDNGIYRSTNFGSSWSQVFNLPGLSLAQHGSTLYAGTTNGVYKSTNGGASWTPINNGMNYSWVFALAAVPNGSGVALFANGVRSVDGGATWTPVTTGLPVVNAYAFAPNGAGGGDLYVGTGQGVFRSSNFGDSWTDMSFILSLVRGLEVTPSGSVLAGTDIDIFRSTDQGGTWVETNANAAPLDFAVNLHGANGVSLFGCDAQSGVYKSTDDGVTWVSSNNDIDDIEVNSVVAVPNGSGGSNILLGDYSGIYISNDDGGSWRNVYPQAMPLGWVVTPNGVGGHTVFGGGIGGVVRSNDHGATWTTSGLGVNIQAMATTGNGANIFAGGGPFGVYRSTDDGTTWTLVNNGLTDLAISALLSPDGTNLFAAGGGGVFLSTDHGANWTSVGTGLTAGVFSLALSADGSTLLAGTTGSGVWERPLAEMIPGPVSVNGQDLVPGIAVMQANRPNPFSAATSIQYSVIQAMPVRLTIYDVNGRAVRTLVDGTLEAGERRVTWDGRDALGTRARPGIYWCRLEAGGARLTRKMTLKN